MPDSKSKRTTTAPDPAPLAVCAVIGVVAGLLADFDPLWHFVVGWGLLLAALGAVLRFAMMLADRGNQPHHLKALPQFVSVHGVFALLLLGLGRLIRWPLDAILPTFAVSALSVLTTALVIMLATLIVVRRLWTPGRVAAYFRAEAQRLRVEELREADAAQKRLDAKLSALKPRRSGPPRPTAQTSKWNPSDYRQSLTTDEDRAWNDAMKEAERRRETNQ